MAMSTGKDRDLINVTPLIVVLLVLLIIFLVAMPIVMKMQPLHIPRSADRLVEPVPFLAVVVKPDLSAELSDETGAPPTVIEAADLSRALGDRLRTASKVVFVDFAKGVRWRDAVATIDQIRGLEAQVALKVKSDAP